MAFNDYRPAWAVKGLTAPERLVLLALAEHRNGDKTSKDYNLSCPGYTLLEEETGLSRPSISKAMKGLREKVPLGVTVDPKNRRSNRYTFPWNQTQGKCSPNEPSVPQVNSNKEVNRELDKEGEQGTQQPVPRTGSAAVLHPTSKTDADRIAQLFWELLGSPAHHKPERWSKPFSDLLLRYPAPALEDIIRFAFYARSWKERMMNAIHPMAYLRSVLDPVEGDRCRYEERKQAAGRTLTASATAAPAMDIEIDEDYEQESPTGSNEIEIEELE